MSFFYIFLLLIIGAVGGYSIGHSTGREEGYLEGVSDEYKAGQER